MCSFKTPLEGLVAAARGLWADGLPTVSSQKELLHLRSHPSLGHPHPTTEQGEHKRPDHPCSAWDNCDVVCHFSLRVPGFVSLHRSWTSVSVLSCLLVLLLPQLWLPRVLPKKHPAATLHLRALFPENPICELTILSGWGERRYQNFKAGRGGGLNIIMLPFRK